MTTCGQLWPDAPADDGQPVTCHLEVEGHNPYHHAWWAELHGLEGDARITWHTAFALTLTDAVAGPLTPTSRVKGHVVDEDGQAHLLHEVIPHPTHVLLHDNMPDKPVR